MAASLVEREPAEWDALLDTLGLGDAYLSSSYVEASRVLDPGRPVFLHLADAHGDVVFAAILRRIPGTHALADVTTPYGYGGPVGAGAAPPAERFWGAYETWCAEHRVVTTFVRFHPLFENVRLTPPELETQRLADTATWPLEPEVDLAAGMHSMHRRGARKAEREGVMVTIERAPAALDEFASVYEDAMRRADAAAFYLFPPEYWGALDAMGERLVRADARLDGELVASQLHLANGPVPPWLHYHLGATSERGYAVGAAKLLFLRVAEWGRRQGFVELHLGSGLGGRENSLWQFKQRFSPHPGRPFWLGKAIHDRAAYAELVGSADAEGFFPAYRAPA